MNDNDYKIKNIVIIEIKSIIQKIIEEIVDPQYSQQYKLFDVHSFGSFKLGLNTPDSDLDLVCIGSSLISRSDFFNVGQKYLGYSENITDLQVINSAYVPIIKFKYAHIHVDLLFARLSIPYIFDNLDINDDLILEDLDDKSALSLNGIRIANTILSLIPANARENFLFLGNYIKYWAKKRHIYGNSLGYLGGISWVIMVTKICQMYPSEKKEYMIPRFFLVYRDWRWAPDNPLVLVDNSKSQPNFGYKTWNPRTNKTDAYHLMPIITPTYPNTNSAYNVTASTFDLIKNEIKRAWGIVCDCEHLSKLCESSNFIRQHKFLIFIELDASTKYNKLVWYGWIESRIRIFVQYLEQTEGVKYAYPQKTTENAYAIALNTDNDNIPIPLKGFPFIDITKAVTRFVLECKEQFGNYKKDMKINIHTNKNAI